MKTLSAIIVVTLSFISLAALAEENKSQLGLQIGNVGVSGAASDAGMSNTIGYGAFYEFGASDIFDLSAGLIYSQHTGTAGGTNNKLTQTNPYIGAKFNIGQYDVIVPFMVGDVNIISRSLELGSQSGSATGFGLGAGFGSDFILGEQFSAGLEIRYVYAFEQTVKINNVDVKLIQSFNNIMARFAYRF